MFLKRIATLLLPLFLALLARESCAQVPDAAPPVAEQPTGGIYRRPDLSPAALDLSNLNIAPDKRAALVSQLALLARNYPESKLLNSEWRARALSLALRLSPEDRDCVVANGQLARRTVPKPLETASTLEMVAVEILAMATELVKSAAGKDAPEHVLGLHLLDIAARLNSTNRAMYELHQAEAPLLRWELLVPRKQPRSSLQDEETPDLMLSKSALTLTLFRTVDGQRGVSSKLFTATATKMPNGSKRPMQLYLPSDADRELESAMPDVRTLLQARNSQWPAGWRVEFGPLEATPASQSGAVLGIALVMDSLISGVPLDPKVVPICGLDSKNGKIIKTLDFETLLRLEKNAPAGTVVIVPEQNRDEVYDLLLRQPERWSDILRLSLCTARTLSECCSLSAATRPRLLQQSLDQFNLLTQKVGQTGLTALRQPENLQALEEILNINPNLFSASLLQSAALKKVPSVLSKAGSLKLLRQLGEPVLKAGSKEFPLKTPWLSKLDPSPWSKARTQLDRARSLLNVDSKAYADALTDLAKLYDNLVVNSATNPQIREDLKRRISEGRQRLKEAFVQLKAEVARSSPQLPVPNSEEAPEAKPDALQEF